MKKVEELTPEQQRILLNSGTEQAFTGKLLNEKRQGIYCCARCNNELFTSESKFDSGSGWPSFFQVIEKEKLNYVDDYSKNGIHRVEIRCNDCDSHLGHVFEDGPKPTGLRFCLNSVALTLKLETGQEITG